MTSKRLESPRSRNSGGYGGRKSTFPQAGPPNAFLVRKAREWYTLESIVWA